MGLSHLALARAHDDLDVVAVCDSQAFLVSGVKSQTGIAGYRSVEKMLDEQNLDCVFVATPTSSHFDLGMLALERGVSPFLEKPLTLSHEQSRTLAETATARGVTNQVGYHNRFIGTFREAARLISAGAIGDVHHIDGRAFGQVITKASGEGRTWRADKAAGGGCLHDYACHVIDLMNFLVGAPDAVVGARLSKIYSTKVEDAVHALFSYGSGATGSLETNWSDDSYRKMTTSVTVYGSAGKIYADRQECRVYLRDGQEFEDYESGWTIRYITELQEPVWFYIRGEEYSAQIDAFAAAQTASETNGTNSFASAAEADWVVAEISAADRDGRQMSASVSVSSASSGARTSVAADVARQVAIPRWLDRGIETISPRAHRLRERVQDAMSRRRGR